MKKTIRISAYILLTLTIISLSGCEKDRMTLLTDGQWNFKNLTTDSDNSDIKTLIALGKAVLVDGTLDFSDDGTYEMASPLIDTETGTWKLTGETQLLRTPDGETNGVPASIDKLKKSELVYIETYVYNDITYSAIYTWVR